MTTDKTNNINHIMQKSSFEPFNKSHFFIERENVTVAESMSSSHFHDYYELYCLVSGERYYFIKDKSYHIKRGSLVLIKPYDMHFTRAAGNSGYDRFLLGFSREFLNDFISCIDDINLFECFDKDTHAIKLSLQEQHRIETLLETMLFEQANADKSCDIYLKSALIQLLLIINRYNDRLEDDVFNYINSTHKTISEITGYINNFYYEDITLGSISEQFYISPYHLCRTFKQINGFTFVEYLNGVRIKEAQRLLLKTDMHIAEIAEKVGYKSNTHFGRVFKNITGTSPLIYREMQHNIFSKNG